MFLTFDINAYLSKYWKFGALGAGSCAKADMIITDNEKIYKQKNRNFFNYSLNFSTFKKIKTYNKSNKMSQFNHFCKYEM